MFQVLETNTHRNRQDEPQQQHTTNTVQASRAIPTTAVPVTEGISTAQVRRVGEFYMEGGKGGIHSVTRKTHLNFYGA